MPLATIGDPIPHITLPNTEGVGVNLGHQSRAGHWQVLAFVEPNEAPQIKDVVIAARDRLKAIGANIYLIALCAPDASMEGVDLFDESRQCPGFLVGKPTSGIAVLAPSGCLSAQVHNLDEAIAHCEAGAAKTTSDLITATAPVLLIDNLFDDDLCDRLMAFWNESPKQQGSVATSSYGNEAMARQIKRRQDVVIPDGPLFEEIKKILGRKVLPQVTRAYQMQIASMAMLVIGEYNESDAGAFAAHRDNTTPYTAHRRFAMSANLNTGDFEGGEVRFPEFGPNLYKPSRGGCVIFSCGLLHEAMPVTKGSRIGLFSFMTDAAGLEQEKAMQEKLRAESHEKVPAS